MSAIGQMDGGAAAMPVGAASPPLPAWLRSVQGDEAIRASLAFCMYTYECLERLQSRERNMLPRLSALDFSRLPVYGFYPQADRFRALWSDPALHLIGPSDLGKAEIGDPCHFCGTFEHVDKTEPTYLAFIGSTTVRDWLDNVSAYSSWSARGSEHAGFASRADSMQLDGIIARLNAGQRIVLCGHSLGGAVAALVTRRVLSDPRLVHAPDLVARLRCVTFAAPFYCNDTRGFRAEHFLHIAHASDAVVTSPLLLNAAVTAIRSYTKDWAQSASLTRMGILFGDCRPAGDAETAAAQAVAAVLRKFERCVAPAQAADEDLAPADEPGEVAADPVDVGAGGGIVPAHMVTSAVLAGVDLLLSTAADGYRPHGRFVLIREQSDTVAGADAAETAVGATQLLSAPRVSIPNMRYHLLASYYHEMLRVGLLPHDAAAGSIPASTFDSAITHTWASRLDLKSARTCAWLWRGADAHDTINEFGPSVDHRGKSVLVVELRGDNLDWISAIRLKGDRTRGKLLARSRLPDAAVFAIPTPEPVPEAASADGMRTVPLQIRFKWHSIEPWKDVSVRFDVDRSPSGRRSDCAPDTTLFAAMLLLMRSRLAEDEEAARLAVATPADGCVRLEGVARVDGSRVAEFELRFAQSTSTTSSSGSAESTNRWRVSRSYAELQGFDGKIRDLLKLDAPLPPSDPWIWGLDSAFVGRQCAAVRLYMECVLQREGKIIRACNRADGNATVAAFINYTGPMPLPLSVAFSRPPSSCANMESAKQTLAIVLSSMPQLVPSTADDSTISAAMYARVLASFAFLSIPTLHDMATPRLDAMLADGKPLRPALKLLLEDVKKRHDLELAHDVADLALRSCTSCVPGKGDKELLGYITPAERPGFVSLLPFEVCAHPAWQNRSAAVVLARGDDTDNAAWERAGKIELATLLATRATVAYWTVCICRDVLTINPFSAMHFLWPALAVVVSVAAPFVGIAAAATVALLALITGISAISAVFASLSMTVRRQYSQRVRDLLAVVRPGVDQRASSTYCDEEDLIAAFKDAIADAKGSPSIVGNSDSAAVRRRAELMDGKVLPKVVGGKHIAPHAYQPFLQQLLFIDSLHQLRKFVFDAAMVPVFGLQNAGKSTLCSLLTKRYDIFQPGARNTRVPTCFEFDVAAPRSGQISSVTLVDFPALTDESGVCTGLGLEIMPAAAAIVIVVPFDQANTDPVHALLRVLTQRAGTPPDIMVCLTRVDAFLRMERDSATRADRAPSMRDLDDNPMRRARQRAAHASPATGPAAAPVAAAVAAPASIPPDVPARVEETGMVLERMAKQFIAKFQEARANLQRAVSGDVRVHIVPVMFTDPAPIVDVDTIIRVNERACTAAPHLVLNQEYMCPPHDEDPEMIMFGPLALRRFLQRVCQQWRSGLRDSAEHPPSAAAASPH